MVMPAAPLWINDGINPPYVNPNITEEEFETGLSKLRQDNIRDLWQAATDYQNARISGAAFMLVTMGIAKEMPVSKAVHAWVTSIWVLYYQRKPLITHEWNSKLYDFSQCGDMPHSVPELMQEVMG